MNVIRIYGGLGNQFFQYALGQIQKANGIEVSYDIAWFKNPSNNNRPLSLQKFNVIIPTSSFLEQKTLNEVSLHYVDDMMFTRLDGFNFFGYWQHPRYFAEVLPQLKQEFTVQEKFYTEQYLKLKKKIKIGNSTSLHVRRGDYIQINGHHLLTAEYYTKALEYAEGNVYVFSDDIPWCKIQFIGKQFVFVEIEDFLSFELMRLCKNNIIANSTFSWWAAYLNDNPKKIVVTPDQWRISKQAQESVSNDILRPAGWEVISLTSDWNGK